MLLIIKKLRKNLQIAIFKYLGLAASAIVTITKGLLIYLQLK